jgi:hypothetical protein
MAANKVLGLVLTLAVLHATGRSQSITIGIPPEDTVEHFELVVHTQNQLKSDSVSFELINEAAQVHKVEFGKRDVAGFLPTTISTVRIKCRFGIPDDNKRIEFVEVDPQKSKREDVPQHWKFAFDRCRRLLEAKLLCSFDEENKLQLTAVPNALAAEEADSLFTKLAASLNSLDPRCTVGSEWEIADEQQLLGGSRLAMERHFKFEGYSSVDKNLLQVAQTIQKPRIIAIPGGIVTNGNITVMKSTGKLLFDATTRRIKSSSEEFTIAGKITGEMDGMQMTAHVEQHVTSTFRFLDNP